MVSLPIQLMNLCIIRDKDKILLAMKKRDFGKGKWNGYGGKLEGSETLEEALVREIKEESNLDLLKYEKRGEIFFHFPDIIRHVHIYEGLKWEGKLEETEEMSPKWFTITELPFNQMWESDKEWYPYFLNRVPFGGNVVFDKDYKIISMDIKSV